MMERSLKTISISSLDQVPSLDEIRAWPRQEKVKLEFAPAVQDQRATIGALLKRELDGFLVGIHTQLPEISIGKLITEEEIEAHQDFFEQCAKDYRQLGGELIFQWVEAMGLILNLEFPLNTFHISRRKELAMGKMGDWHYHPHGFHCNFVNQVTGQDIEVPLTHGLEFGDLDPYFFANFILTTPAYQPLPVPIFEKFADGVRIIDKMVSLGKFEPILLPDGRSGGMVVVDRKPLDPQPFLALNQRNALGKGLSDSQKEPD
jgi:hypothetical protein